jgi:hypothetical protein
VLLNSSWREREAPATMRINHAERLRFVQTVEHIATAVWRHGVAGG